MKIYNYLSLIHPFILKGEGNTYWTWINSKGEKQKVAFSFWVRSFLWALFEIDVQEVKNLYHLSWKTVMSERRKVFFYGVITCYFIHRAYNVCQVFFHLSWNFLPSHRLLAVRPLSITSICHHHLQPYQTSYKPPLQCQTGPQGADFTPEMLKKYTYWTASGRLRKRCESSASAQWPSCPQSDLDHFPSISRMLRVRTLSGLQSALWKRG